MVSSLVSYLTLGASVAFSVKERLYYWPEFFWGLAKMILRRSSTQLGSHSTMTLTLAIFSYLFEAVAKNLIICMNGQKSWKQRIDRLIDTLKWEKNSLAVAQTSF